MTKLNKIEYRIKSLAFALRMIFQKVHAIFFCIYTLFLKVLFKIKLFQHV